MYNRYSSVFSNKLSSNKHKQQLHQISSTQIRNYYAVVYMNPKPKFIHTFVVRRGKFLRRLNLICGIIEDEISI